MSFFISLSHVDFEYNSAKEPLFNDLNLQLDVGWTGIVGANGSGKTTLLQLIAGRLNPDAGCIQVTGRCRICEQEILLPPDNLNDFFASYDSYAFRLRRQLELDDDMPERWDTLSMGERKKLQIAAALFGKPDILCLDEPTNHLDASARDSLMAELRNYRGIGVLVSHDRELLNSLCTQCLFIEHGKTSLRSGGISAGMEAARVELEGRLKLRQQLKTELKSTKQELQRRRRKEQLSQNRNSKRKVARHDHAAKERIDAARVTGRSRSASDAAGAQARRVARADRELKALGNIKVPQYGLNIPYGCYSSKNVLLDFSPRRLALGQGGTLEVPELVIDSHDRIALTGDNGSGKSTLLRQIVREMNLYEPDFLYLPQELDQSLTDEIYASLRRLSRDEFSQVMNVVASLGSRPECVLDSCSCSPGEWRKLFFGLGVLRSVSMIVMDEPTNHLDLPSIECMEAALADCRCALLLVSHDHIFLRNLCSVHWSIENISPQNNILNKGYF